MWWMVFGLVWAGFGVVTALAADARGRDPALWFLLGVVFGVFALAAVLVLENENRTRPRSVPALPAREHPDRHRSGSQSSRQSGARRVIEVHKGMQVIADRDRFVVGLSVFQTRDDAIAFIDQTQGD
jgi:hypothetical protein